MEISEQTLDDLRAALPYMDEEQVAEALALLGDEFSVTDDRPITPAEFRAQLKIMANGTIRLLHNVVQPWQVDEFALMDEAWMAAVGMRAPPEIRRCWWERPKAHAKTSDTASYVCWALTCAMRKVFGVIGAEDFDQAAIMRQHIEEIIGLNNLPIVVKRNEIINPRTGAWVKVLTSDAPSTHGISPDFVIADEVCHWRSQAMWDTLMASHDKREWSLFMALTNAGWMDTWAYKARANVMADPNWRFHRLDGPTAPWVTRGMLDNERRHLTNPMEFERLWLNQWVSGTGEGLDDSVLTSAVDPELAELAKPEPGMYCAAGLDIGVKRHRTALYVTGLWRNRIAHVATPKPDPAEGTLSKPDAPAMPPGTYRLCYGRNWTPKPNVKVDLDAVEMEVERVARAFHCAVYYDPHECEQVAQRLTKRGVRMVEITQTAKNKQRMATVLLETLNDHRLRLYHDPMLLADLRAASIVDKSNGFCLVSPDDERGHGDALTALQLSLLGFAGVRQFSEKERLARMLGIDLQKDQSAIAKR